MCDLLIAGLDDPQRLVNVLADIFGVEPKDVDVSHEDDYESQNWDARVTCQYAERRGDLDWSLSVYSVEGVAARPTEPQVASELAQRVQASVFFPYEGTIPSVWRIATASGETFYARIQEPELEGGDHVVLQLEQPVDRFPAAEVAPLEDVVREHQIPTPVVDQEIPYVSVQGGVEQLVRLREGLVVWERLVCRMATGWPPSKWYSGAIYVDDLKARDEVGLSSKNLEGSIREAVNRTLETLDAKYRELTIDDAGRALSETAAASESDIQQGEWYWRRRPVSLPWSSREAHTE
ncbi:hypothetical protein [Streptomyces buecherae]|uniref:Uncharacterized protein n=1 Tax=Streptomyces buecherae TaxID=2763006 RepID=A0A7H8NAH9_9ACTN|nr:hypothetical protein [Streptomyces buecherae]QKW51356.1 hypothetical protein HUT08_19485 [Streptomyces buecherae]